MSFFVGLSPQHPNLYVFLSSYHSQCYETNKDCKMKLMEIFEYLGDVEQEKKREASIERQRRTDRNRGI